jgi:hypothetical protein
MVQTGLKRAVLEQLGVETWCGVHDPESHLMAQNLGMTRSAAGIRRAWQKFGNDMVLAIGDAPTAITEAVRLIREHGWRPQLVIGLPVGLSAPAKQGRTAPLPAGAAHHQQRHARRVALGGQRGQCAHDRCHRLAGRAGSAERRRAVMETGGELRRAEYDLSVLAPNGLRRGRSTGSCATAAVRAALYRLLAGMTVQQTEVSLPDGLHYLCVPIRSVSMIDDDTRRRKCSRTAAMIPTTRMAPRSLPRCGAMERRDPLLRRRGRRHGHHAGPARSGWRAGHQPGAARHDAGGRG